jgi:hypothetical protein
MLALALLTAAAVNAAPSMAMDPAQRDSQCLVAIEAERGLGPLAAPARDYFEQGLKAGRDPELVELLTIQAEETILPNRNRRPIAETCLVLYQVLRLQDKARDGGER